MEPIVKLYQLRHQINELGFSKISKELKVSESVLSELYESEIHGSKDISNILKETNKNKLQNMIKELEMESQDDHFNKYQAKLKNLDLVNDLNKFRKNMLGIGTNKIKRRLNKISKTNTLAKAIRLALEIEDKNISAKKYRGDLHYYEQKYNLIIELINLFKLENWTFGKEKSQVFETDYVIYFEIPGCEQISWHCNFPKELSKTIPDYKKPWDRKINSTLYKIANVIKNNYPDITAKP